MILKLRKAEIKDSYQYFEWRNDPLVRKNSYNSKLIDLDSHNKWFSSKIMDSNIFFFIFENELNHKIGQVRIDLIDDKNAIINVSVSKDYRGKGYASELILRSSNHFLENNKNVCINAYIKKNNSSSKKVFENAGFVFIDEVLYKQSESFQYKKY